MDALAQLPAAGFITAATVLGLVIGSFLNVVIYRLPLMLQRGWRRECAELTGMPAGEEEPFNLMVPRSRCPQCGHLITALQNIPLLSYLLQRGRCRHCGSPISARYPAVEALTGVLTGVVAWHFGVGATAGWAMVLTWTLIALAFIDLEHQLLPDDITLPLLWLGLALALGGEFTDLRSAVIGAMAGYLALWSVYHGFRLLTGKEGMGYGDFKLLAALGAWLGWQLLPAVLLLSSLVGAIVGVTLVAAGRDRNIPIPFGPYLAAAGWIGLLWGRALTDWYLGVAGV